MALLERWNPSRDLERFRHEVDDLLEKFGLERGAFLKDWESFSALRPAIEAYGEGDKFVVRMELPGIDPKKIEVKVTGGVLTVKGSREQDTGTKKNDFYRREIRYGSFERSMSLPKGMQAEDLKASYRDGILELSATMPKDVAPKEVKIEVEGHEGEAGSKKDESLKRPHETEVGRHAA
jgi:HSP20 family protein